MKKKNISEIPQMCMFCEHASIIKDESNVLCEKRGIVNCEYSCKKFFYDPLKRVPKPQPKLPKMSKEDLVI